MNPARPSGAFQYGTQPLRNPFGVHALRPITAAPTNVARQKPLRRALAISATLLGLHYPPSAAECALSRAVSDEPPSAAHLSSEGGRRQGGERCAFAGGRSLIAGRRGSAPR